MLDSLLAFVLSTSSLAALLALATAAVGVTLWFKSNRDRALGLAWSEAARKRGLRVTEPTWFEGPSITGEIDGFTIDCHRHQTGGKNKTTWTRVRVRPAVPLPRAVSISREGVLSPLAKLVGYQDIQVGVPRMGDALMIQGTNEADVRAWLGEPAAAPLASCLSSPQDCIDAGIINLAVRGTRVDTLEPLMDKAMGLARGLQEARVRVWRELGERPEATLTWERGLVSVHGTFEGVPLQISGDPRLGHYRVQAALGLELPAELRFDKGSSDLGDPVLDRMLCITGLDRDSAAALFDDDLREDLLAVVHGHPGSSVTAEAVTLEGDAFSDPELLTRIHDVVRLVNSLERRWIAVHGEAARRPRPTQAIGG